MREMSESCCGSAERPGGSGESPAGPSLDTDHALGALAADGFAYFRDHAHADTGLVADSTRPGSPASIAVVGFALAAYPVAAHRGWMSRADALRRTLATLRFFEDAPQDESPEAAAFFDGPDRDEAEVRRIAEALYRAADWNWARNGGLTVTHGWTPEAGFLPHRWRGYDEALILYLMGLGSPTHPLPGESYRAWTSTYEWREAYGTEYLYAGPLFTHQYSHVWVDFRGIRDAYMGARGIDYFENSRRATLVHREYAIRNPRGFDGYCHCCWGLTASDGPGPAERTIDGHRRRFYDYLARGAPGGPDDGTVAPWGAVASLPFAPEIVLEAIAHFRRIGLGRACPYGFEATFNATFPVEREPGIWISPCNYGLNQGPLVLMIENHRSGLLWRLLRGCPHLVRGLRRAGFEGGWL